MSPWFSLNHISHLATVEIRVVRLGSFQNLYLSFAIVEITHGVTANRDDTDFHHAKPQILYNNNRKIRNPNVKHEYLKTCTCNCVLVRVKKNKLRGRGGASCRFQRG